MMPSLVYGLMEGGAQLYLESVDLAKASLGTVE